MSKLVAFFVNYFPVWTQNIAVTIVNCRAYGLRRSGFYCEARDEVKKIRKMTKVEMDGYISTKRKKFLDYAVSSSEYYKEYSGCSLSEFPLLEKPTIINDIDKLLTISKSSGVKSSTGGTTGASMTIYYTKKCLQERMAYLDEFRSSHGYELGERVAWFSGKDILGRRMVSDCISRYDFVNKIRFYSTFHISEENFHKYWESLMSFKPRFIVGFPSSVYEICLMAKSKGLFLESAVSVFFPTAETVLDMHREVISEVMGCDIYDQYASSEGAPFIFECDENNYHIDETTGVFEIKDQGEIKDIDYATEGELLVTSFTSYGVPLIRYRVGDRVSLASASTTCKCGGVGRVVEKIDGRETDCLVSKEKGRVNLGNLSNATKGVSGLVCFQAVQENLNSIDFSVVVNKEFREEDRKKFILALRTRLGESISINVQVVDHIAREKSGKFRIVKNMIV